MVFLSPNEQRTLALICDTFVPALPSVNGDDPNLIGCGAIGLNIPTHLEEAIERVSDDANRQQLKLALNALENGFFNGLTARQWGAFSELSLEERTAVLQSWAESSIPQARQLFQSLKRLTLFLFYSVMPEGSPNPTWPSLGYKNLPNRADAAPRPIKPLEITENTTLYTDVLVIGSGAGGGVAAAELSAAGQDVIVIEKGPYYAEQDFHGRELESMEKLFERHGSMTTADLSMMVLAGSTLGGGTTINWSASLRPPDYVLNEWASEYGFTGANSAAFQASLDAVSQRMNVNTAESHPNRNNAVLEAGCRALGYDVSVIPRNVKGCEECGFCNFGCSFGAKQGTLKTYLQDAYDRGTRILVGARVERVLHRHGTAYGAEVLTYSPDGHLRRVTVKAKWVIAAAGSLHTPALLLRSGLTNGNIGANLHLHPVTVTYGLFDDEIDPWQGPPMTRLAAQFANLDGHGYGVRLETAPVHPGIAALSMPWQSGRGHKRLMGRLNHMANIIVITRDYHSGRVTVDKQGEPVLHYRLHPYDARHMMRGTLEALRIHVAAGANEVSSPHNEQIVYNHGDNLESFLEQVETRGFRANSFTLSSAHQMSSCRIGGDSALGAVDPSGESYEVRNLFVMDGSVLPTASGVNPMVSIMGTVHYLAQGLKARL